MHKKIFSHIPINDIYVCMHSQKENCDCRKPKPFFLLQAKKKYNLNLNKCYFIGDRFSDMMASKIVGCKSIFIDRNYKETPAMDFVEKFKGLKAATKYILREIKND